MGKDAWKRLGAALIRLEPHERERAERLAGDVLKARHGDKEAWKRVHEDVSGDEAGLRMLVKLAQSPLRDRPVELYADACRMPDDLAGKGAVQAE